MTPCNNISEKHSTAILRVEVRHVRNVARYEEKMGRGRNSYRNGQLGSLVTTSVWANVLVGS